MNWPKVKCKSDTWQENHNCWETSYLCWGLWWNGTNAGRERWRKRTNEGKREKGRSGWGGCYCLLAVTYLELSTIYNALDVLLLNDGCSKWMCNASASLKVFSWLCCERIEKLLRLTEVGVWIVKSGCVRSALDPMHVSVCFRILLCSLLLMGPIVVDDKPAWHKLRLIRQRAVDPMYDNSHLSHTYL